MKKRGSTLTLETVIFFILNIAFFVVMSGFVYNSVQNSAFYEQNYAKQIALIIDNSKTETSILIDVSEIVKIANENKKNINDIVKVDKAQNKISVSLRDGRDYSHRYFTNANIITKIDGNWLTINVQK